MSVIEDRITEAKKFLSKGDGKGQYDTYRSQQIHIAMSIAHSLIALTEQLKSLPQVKEEVSQQNQQDKFDKREKQLVADKEYYAKQLEFKNRKIKELESQIDLSKEQ